MVFCADLALGKAYESLLLEYIEHDSVIFSPPRCKGWDLIMTYGDNSVKWEVKADRLAFKTGNVAIEIACNGVPSGITSTEADFYAYFIVQPFNDPTLYIIPTDKLKDLTANPEYRRVKGGDGWRSAMVLIPLIDIYEFIF